MPNTDEDPRGLITRLFAAVAPWRARALGLKSRRHGVYVVAKYSVNTVLLMLVFLPVYAVLQWIERAGIAALY